MSRLKALARFVPDLAVTIARLAKDTRLERRRRLVLVPLAAYLALPFDLVPDFIPVVGLLDDALVVALALRVLMRGGAGTGLLAEHWPGPPESLRVVLRLAGGESAP